MRELMVYGELRDHAFALSETLWTGTYVAPAGPRPVSSSFPRAVLEPPLLDFYHTVFTTAFPVVLSDEDVVVFPVQLALDAHGGAAVGTVDGDTVDVYGPREGGMYRRFHGVPHLGGTSGAELGHGPLYHAGVQDCTGSPITSCRACPGNPWSIGTAQRDCGADGLGTGLLVGGVLPSGVRGGVAGGGRAGQAYVDAITVSRVDSQPRPGME
ncbi:MAG: hypothetical protein HC888_04695 [Candidatus Competibacteraceae bacterium]|nr:hypothetical protein [Candidatus Competibacteraceae bacterium]